jgi:hypothetical protein
MGHEEKGEKEGRNKHRKEEDIRRKDTRKRNSKEVIN